MRPNMDQIREFHAILDEENRDVVANLHEVSKQLKLLIGGQTMSQLPSCV